MVRARKEQNEQSRWMHNWATAWSAVQTNYLNDYFLLFHASSNTAKSKLQGATIECYPLHLDLAPSSANSKKACYWSYPCCRYFISFTRKGLRQVAWPFGRLLWEFWSLRATPGIFYWIQSSSLEKNSLKSELNKLWLAEEFSHRQKMPSHLIQVSLDGFANLVYPSMIIRD